MLVWETIFPVEGYHEDAHSFNPGLSAVDNYLLLHMTDFMTTHSLVSLAMTSRRFLEPMIQTRLNDRVRESVWVETTEFIQYPISIFRDATHTHLDFAFDTLVYKKNITIHTISWIFNWRSIVSSSYVWDYVVVDGETTSNITSEFANITLFLSRDEYAIQRLRFSHLTHIQPILRYRNKRRFVVCFMYLFVAVCHIYHEPMKERLIAWLVILFLIYIVASPPLSPVISMVAT